MVTEDRTGHSSYEVLVQSLEEMEKALTSALRQLQVTKRQVQKLPRRLEENEGQIYDR